MSETELEMRQAKGEEQKREQMKDFTNYQLVSIVDNLGTVKDWFELNKILEDFIIEKGYAVE